MSKPLPSSRFLVGMFLLSILHFSLSAQDAVFTYQGRVQTSGDDFSGTGQFKFALVDSTNFNHQATATANPPSGGFITIINVTLGGSSYAVAPAVVISGGGGSGATAHATVSGGAVATIRVDNPGFGYTSTPTVTVAPPPPNIVYTTYWSNDGTSNAGSEPVAAVNVPVDGGLFTLVLGDTAIPNMLAINAALFAQPNLQLRIWFNDGVKGFAALSPPQNLTPTPYAINAESARNLLGTLSAARISGTIPVSQLPDAVVTNHATDLVLGGAFNGVFSGNGGALTNLPGVLTWQIVTGLTQQAQSNTGYLLTNKGTVTITLPLSMNIGGIVRVSGADNGGWKIAQNANQVIVGSGFLGNVGLTWIARDFRRNWTAVASSSDGTRLIAAEMEGQLYTSTDSGATWTPRELDRNWTSVASSADGSKLVATTSDRIHTSSDGGGTWTPRESTRKWQSVASSADGVNLVAVVRPGQIYTSSDSGVTWTPRESARDWRSVASSSDGTKLVALNQTGQIYVSSDSGINWIPRESARSWWSVASSTDGTKLIAAVQGGQLYTSIDSGVTWTPRENARFWLSVASSADGTKLAATGLTLQIFTSSDSGVTWTPSANLRDWYCMASSADGSKLVAAAGLDQIYTSVPGSVLSTTAGVAGYLQGGQNTAIELQYFGGGRFLPISREGSIFAY